MIAASVQTGFTDVLVRLQGGVVQDWALEGDAADRIGEIAGSAMAISSPPAAAKHRNP